jgi:hypothetical protein
MGQVNRHLDLLRKEGRGRLFVPFIILNVVVGIQIGTKLGRIDEISVQVE